jgi:hypothetical protein
MLKCFLNLHLNNKDLQYQKTLFHETNYDSHQSQKCVNRNQVYNTLCLKEFL